MSERQVSIIRTLRRRGFSLIELLCVIAIILILAGLIAGPILQAYRRVKEMKTEFESSGVVDLVQKRLKDFFVPLPAYPAHGLEELRRMGVFDSEMMRRVQAKEVIYHPFSSNDPEDTVIAEVLVRRKRSLREYHPILKKDLYANEN
ncbi:MAG: type II secretion system protein [Verrucomicrobia bacterium]|nr:type II secretion system protein [Verrucomicrobiota bacterium]